MPHRRDMGTSNAPSEGKKACGLSHTYVNDAVNENRLKASDASIERVRKISKMYIYQNVDKYYPLPLVKNKED